MIKLYGKKYAKNDREAIETLFQPDCTFNGFYKVLKAGIYLSDMQGNERVFIRADGLGPVTTTKDHNGKRRYMFSTSTIDDLWLGKPESYSESVNGAKEIAKALCV